MRTRVCGALGQIRTGTYELRRFAVVHRHKGKSEKSSVEAVVLMLSMGIEPTLTAYEAVVLPLNNKSDVRVGPLRRRTHGVMYGNRTRLDRFTAGRLH